VAERLETLLPLRSALRTDQRQVLARRTGLSFFSGRDTIAGILISHFPLSHWERPCSFL
jgi:hypothetical protein